MNTLLVNFINVIYRSWAYSSYMGGGIALLAYGLNLEIGSYGCLYFFKNLSDPVDKIYPLGST